MCLTPRLQTANWVPDDLAPVGVQITFTTADHNLPIPDPRYLAIHAACAQVIHATGMAKCLDKVLQDMEEMDVLPEDGCSDILAVALFRVDWRTKLAPEAGRRDGEETCAAG